MTNQNDLLATVSSDAANIITYLQHRPLERRQLRNDVERRQWAVRDFRAAVAAVIYGDEPRRVTTEEADQAIRNVETRERVWQYLEARA